MSYVHSSSKIDGVRSVDYRPAYVHRYEDGYELPIRAWVGVYFSPDTSTSLNLEIDVARALYEALAIAMAEHAAAQQDSASGPGAVA